MRHNSLGVLAALCLSFTACDTREPVMSDADVALLRDTYPHMKEECIELMRFEGVYSYPVEVDRCFPMTEPRKFHGVWRTQFEGSIFCPNATDLCQPTIEGPIAWLSTSAGVELPIEPATGREPRYFELVFVGRSTKEKGNYGHMGASDYEILVDDLISAREIQPSGMDRET